MTTTALMSADDVAAHVAARGPVRRTPKSAPKRIVLGRFPAGAPRGSWPAEEFAQEQRREGVPAEVVMDLDMDAYLVIVRAGVAS